MSTLLEQLDRTPLTYLVLLAYVTMALLTGIAEPGHEQLVEYGALFPILVHDGEPWRLVSYAFLHGGLLHLFLNSYFLFLVGPILERSLGSVRFALLYVAAAAGGGIGGTLVQFPLQPLVGGSGALFGMMGAAVAVDMRRGRHLLEFLHHPAGRQWLVLITINLVIGFLIPFVSNAAHIGGLVAGFVLTFCFFERGRTPVDRIGRWIRAGWIALLASLVLYCLAPVLRFDYQAKRYLRTKDPAHLQAYLRTAPAPLPALGRRGLDPSTGIPERIHPMWDRAMRRWSRGR